LEERKTRVNARDAKMAAQLAKRTEITFDEFIELAVHLGVKTLEYVFEDPQQVKEFKAIMLRKRNYARRN
jgi:hypothetical protein